MIAPSAPQPRFLAAMPIGLGSDAFHSILQWPFPDQPFFVRQVAKMLTRDIPHLVQSEDCAIWGFVDPLEGDELVGFGAICLSNEYLEFSGGRQHSYIPLLSARPGIKSYGYGQFIVDYLVAEAVLMAFQNPSLADHVYLDVYTANQKARSLYENKCGFVCLNSDKPVPDSNEGDEPYVIMARSIRPQSMD